MSKSFKLMQETDNTLMIVDSLNLAFRYKHSGATDFAEDYLRTVNSLKKSYKANKVIIAGAGGAAHLPGMVASLTALPVIGVPVPLANLEGMDSLLSIVQMPAGIPVATVGIGNAKNAGILAARILATADSALLAKVESAMQKLNEEAKAKGAALKARRNQKTGF